MRSVIRTICAGGGDVEVSDIDDPTPVKRDTAPDRRTRILIDTTINRDTALGFQIGIAANEDRAGIVSQREDAIHTGVCGCKLAFHGNNASSIECGGRNWLDAPETVGLKRSLGGQPLHRVLRDLDGNARWGRTYHPTTRI